MPKQIKLTQEAKKQIIIKAIENLKKNLAGNFEESTTIKVNVNLTDVETDIKPTVIFSDVATHKYRALVDSFNGEVGWNGIVTRTDDLTFVIEDIVVYPQEVTGVTVTTDETELMKWQLNFDNETFKKIRFQAHSHVRMGVKPSSTDLTLYNNYLATLKDDDYYIFMITNKQGEINMWLYDLKTNLKYTKDEINIKFERDMSDWIEKQKHLVKEKTYATHYDWQDYLGTFKEDDSTKEPVDYGTFNTKRKSKKKGSKKI